MNAIINPIEPKIKSAIKESSSIFIAVPFLSANTVKKLFSKDELKKVQLRQILIKLDESHSISYDLDAVKHLLDCGFEVRFDNSIHLKLYILGEVVFISSGNLTDGGLKNNFELTVQTNEEESKVQSIFDELWKKNKSNQITLKYVEDNWPKYLYLKKKYPREKVNTPVVNIPKLTASDEKIIEAVLHNQTNWERHYKLSAKLLKKRHKLLDRLRLNGYKQALFYASKGHKNRKKNLFYDFVYGDEEKLAGTGLREAQFKDVFTDPKFEQVLFYIYPQYKNSDTHWSLEDKGELMQFCEGLFEFKLRSFREAMPIRLASYFYPEHFLPIFNLGHLGEICSILGFKASSNDRATKLCEYNLFLKERLKDLPYNNFVKSTILYRLLYTLKVKNEMDKNGTETIEKFIKSHNKVWVRNNLQFGLDLIKKIN